MTLYYNKNNYEIRDLDDSLIQGWIENNNPKLSQWEILPNQPSSAHIWINGEWILSQSEVPQSISARQIRLWLINHGIPLSSVEDAIDSIADPIIRESTKIEWEYAPYVERNHPMIVPLAQTLGLTQYQLDAAFIEAQNI